MTAHGVLLAVPNVSEGRDPGLVRRIAEAPCLLDLHTDPDHNRAVVTYGGTPDAVRTACRELLGHAIHALDIRAHEGVHPRFGVLDVLPLVPLGAGTEVASEVADTLGDDIARLDVPVHRYDEAGLPALRRRLASGTATPWKGPDEPHPSAGVVCLGVRGPMIAFNVNLRGSIDAATEVARGVRESSGGLPGVRALALPIASRGLVQVSMNLTRPPDAGPAATFTAVAQASARHGLEVVDAEIVGLLPAAYAQQLRSLPMRAEVHTVEAALETAGITRLA